MAKILIVDDQEQNRYILEVLLRGNGHEVTSTTNGAEALAAARENPPEVVITDILMPVMDGFTLCRLWKKDPLLKHIPLVFYTATYTDSKDEKFALSLGAERFIIKPTEPEAFMAMLAEVLESHSKGSLRAARQPEEDEDVFLTQYNQALIHKLEDKVAQLDKANAELTAEIEERRRAQEKLARSEERFSRIFHQSPVGMAITTVADGVNLEVNEAFCRATGYKMAEIKGAKAEDLRLWANPEDRVLGYKVIVEQGSLHDYVFGFVHGSGECRYGTWSSQPIELDEQDCLISVISDITDRVRAVQALRASEEKYRTLMEAVADPVVVFDLGGRCIYTNRAFSALFGWRADEMTGEELPFVPEEFADKSRRRLMEVMEGKPITNHETIRRARDGRMIDVSISAAAFNDDQGRAAGVVVGLRDISARKAAENERNKLEDQLRQAQKMDAIGTLAGGIAHDFNNILGVILGFADLCMLSCRGDREMQSKLQKVLDAGLRAKDLVKQILTFSRQTDQEVRPVRVAAVAQELGRMLGATIPSNIHMRLEARDDCVVMADHTQLLQVLMNICTNAVQAMGDEGGSLVLGLDKVDIDEHSALLMPDMEPGLYQKITVSDTGRGIPPEIIDRIFDPFFTTKKKGEGTGLGLSVAHGIVKNHGGKITVYSEPGMGTTFCVYLPLPENHTGDAPLEDADTALPPGNEYILFVDDEELLAEVSTQVLNSLGYRVNTFVSSLEALEEFRAHGEKYDLVVTDLNMPKMNGLDLAREIHRLRADMPIILSTGFSETISAELAKGMGIKKLIMKPIVARDLAAAIREALD